MECQYTDKCSDYGIKCYNCANYPKKKSYFYPIYPQYPYTDYPVYPWVCPTPMYPYTNPMITYYVCGNSDNSEGIDIK
jgi:hypothetical protein